MSHDWVLWILVTASALHVVEEHGGRVHLGRAWQRDMCAAERPA
jgi:hypothetical protein